MGRYVGMSRRIELVGPIIVRMYMDGFTPSSLMRACSS